MRVGAKRNKGNAGLENFPGLYVQPYGVFYMKHPTTRKQLSLGTNSLQKAKALYVRVMQRWEEEKAGSAADLFLKKIDQAIQPEKTNHRQISFREYAKKWREVILGIIVKKDKIVCKQTKIRQKKGEQEFLAKKTQEEYGRQCRQLENSAHSDFQMSDKDLLRKSRKLLAEWSDRPAHYNHLLAVMSHIFQQAIIDDVTDSNPAKYIDPLPTGGGRKVYIDDEAYIKITDKLTAHYLKQGPGGARLRDGEWRAKICDLLYMLSSRPCEPFKFTENNINFNEPGVFGFGIIRFQHGKNKVWQIIDMNQDLHDLIKWFIDWKTKQRIITPNLLVYPLYYPKGVKGRPITHRVFATEFKNAVIGCGYFDWIEAEVDGKKAKRKSAHYQLRDLRKKGLTDEYVNQGENDKGGHKTQAMADHYRLHKPPMRASNTLVSIRPSKKS